MGANDALRAIRVARGNRLVDFRMGAIGDLVLAGVAEGDAPLFDQPFGDRRMQGGKDRIAGNDGEDVVKGHVGAFEARDVMDSLPVGIECSRQFLQILFAGMLGGVAGEADFEEGAGILELAHAIGLGQQMARGAGEAFDDRLGRGPRDLGAFTGANFDHAHLLQMKKGLAYRWPADPELGHEIALRGQLVARRKIRIPDHLLQAGSDVLVKSTPFDGGIAHLVYLSYHCAPKSRQLPDWSQSRGDSGAVERVQNSGRKRRWGRETLVEAPSLFERSPIRRAEPDG
jgi:hypothetical protein